VLTRATYAGGQRYAATWTGDNTSSWAHMRLSTSQLVNLGLSGFAYAGDDIGGFAGDPPSPELLTRWIEIGAFNPIMRDHYAKGRPPQEVWVHGPDQEAIRRKYIEERYRLMPYIYGLAEENSRDGLPIMRPVFLNFPDVLKNGIGDTENEFMLGGDLLIAPPVTGESSGPNGISLPSAGWYDNWTGQQVSEPGVMETPQLDRLPVFVRPGAIIPKAPLVQSTMDTPQGPLTLEVYPGADCHGSFYFDDGTSFAYKSGGYLRQAVTCASDANGLSLSFGGREGSFRPWWSGVHVVVHGWTGASGVLKIKGKTVAGQVDAAAKTLAVDIPDQPKAVTLRLQ
jgi:alpha-glucosidase